MGPQELIERLDAIAFPLRLRLLLVLSHGERTMGELARAVNVERTLLSFHVRVLHDAGLVTKVRVGRAFYVRLNTDSVRALLDELSRRLLR